jgi:hypothetical protein
MRVLAFPQSRFLNGRPEAVREREALVALLLAALLQPLLHCKNPIVQEFSTGTVRRCKGLCSRWQRLFLLFRALTHQNVLTHDKIPLA